MYLQSYSFFFLRAIIIYKEKKGLLAAGKVDCFVRKSGANGIKKSSADVLLGAYLLMMDVASMGD